MARTVRNAKLQSREARSRLPARKKPYYQLLDHGRHLGYYKGERGGTWLARFFVGAKRYDETRLGIADDKADADGVSVFSFSQAQAAARLWFEKRARQLAGEEPADSLPYDVRTAIKDYLEWYEARGGKARKGTETAANAHILPELGDREVSRLTTKMIRDWHFALATSPARLRSKRGKPARHRAPADNPEIKRRRKATANRVLSILKAALNHAWREGRVRSDEAWRRVTPFKNVDAAVIRYLTEAECKRLVSSTDPAFQPLVRAALLSGCRYGELAALTIADYHPDSGTLLIRASKSGKARHVVLTTEAQLFFRDATAGRESDQLMFTRPSGGKWGTAHQQRPLLKACARARISPAVSFHVLRHTHGSLLAMKGVPLPVIAQQLGHADTRMTEKHYAHLSSSYVADTIRAQFPELGIVPATTVTPLRPSSRKQRRANG